MLDCGGAFRVGDRGAAIVSSRAGFVVLFNAWFIVLLGGLSAVEMIFVRCAVKVLRRRIGCGWRLRRLAGIAIIIIGRLAGVVLHVRVQLLIDRVAALDYVGILILRSGRGINRNVLRHVRPVKIVEIESR